MTDNKDQPSDEFSSLLEALVVPEGYEVREQQTIAWVHNKAGELMPVEICANPIGVSARARDRDGTKWSTRIEWLSPDGFRCDLQVPASQLNGQPGAVMDELAKHGVLLNPKTLAMFRSYLFESQRDPRVPFERTVGHLGFTDVLGESLPSFVLPSRVLRPPLPDGEMSSSERIFFQPDNAVVSLQGYRSCGTLSDWQAAVEPFGEHPLIVFAILIGLSGPFLKVAAEENGGIHFYGPTSKGKTSAAQACASVSGFPGNPSRGATASSLFQTWNTTSNAVEMLLAPHSGMTVILDEVGANDSGINLYNAFSGIAKARLTEKIGMRDQNTWTVMVFSTGEYSVSDHIEQCDVGRATDGSAVRLLELPIETLFDCAIALGAQPLPKLEEMGPLIRGLQEKLTQCYGTALPAFIEGVLQHCCDNGLSLENFIRTETKMHHEALCAGAMEAGFELGTAQIRALNRLALIATIGHLAADDVLPFSNEQVWRAVCAVRDAWLSTTQFLSLEEKIADHLQSFCIAHFQHVRVNDPRACPPTRGWPFFYFEKLNLIVFTKEQLLHAAGSTSLRAVTKALNQQKWLRTNESGRSDAKLMKDMKDIVPTARAFQVMAEPVLGDFLRSATMTFPESVTAALITIDADGVVQDEYNPMPRSNQERIVFDGDVPPDEFFSYEREWENREYIPSLDQGKSFVMPTRRTTVIAKT